MLPSWEMTLYNIDILQNFLKEYHNIDNNFSLLGSDRAFSGFMRGTQDDAFSQSVVVINSPYKFRANKRDGYAIIFNRSGGLVLENGCTAPTLNSGQVACVSPEIPFETTSLSSVNMVMTRLDAKRVGRICSAWLGTSLDAPPELDLKPFSPRLQAQWMSVVNTIDLLHESGEGGEGVMKPLEEYAVSLLLNGHPNSYSAYFNKEYPASAKVVADAEAYIREHAGDPIVPSDVAEFFGCSLGALHKGFEERLGISVRECIYVSRVAKVRKLLLDGSAETYLQVLRSNGFTNTRRFETIYQRLHGESAPQTFNNTRATSPLMGRSSLSSQSAVRVQAHIISTLSKPVKVAELAHLVGMSETKFRAAFKATFGSSPARYILQQRLNWAKWLLANTAKSIATIAAETGFASQAHLTTMLKQTQGVTPGQLRIRVRD
ncbi:helix-turn-helix domain-containing protein [Ochrobactrum intermedium]|uniref:helix-turn-helix domain-containing protein n=1 Tax=Brucella intermedia TaxID=94625 RepID=UPI00128D07C6|nr:helix-turn-helix domain-containing protein [Brucella intermedia]MPR64359.1 helix-turn-helix domain-containing protein [Brucella intermedia]